MNPAIHAKAIAANRHPDWDGLALAATPVLRLLGATLGMLALGLALVAAASGGPAAFLGTAAIACLALGSAALRASAVVDHREAELRGWIDARSGLHNASGLSGAGDVLLARSGGTGALVLLDFADLLEVHAIYGRDTSRGLQQKVIARIHALAGPHGLAARTGLAQFAVLLPGSTTEKAQAIVRRVLGKPSRIEFDAGHSEIVLVPDILYEPIEPGHPRVSDVLFAAATRMADLHAREERRQRFLQRERERHSRPMSLPPAH